MKRKKYALYFSAIAMGVLILDSRSALEMAESGVDICIKTVIPSLFPFFVLSIFLTGSLGNTPIFRPLCRLFRVSSGAETVLISGILGGYPVGAQTASEALRGNRLTKESANRLLMFCSQAGPSFLFGMVAAQFPEGKYAWQLLAVQLLSAWSVAQIAAASSDQAKYKSNFVAITLPEAMKKAIHAIASVCGWVIVFRVIIGFVHRLSLPDYVRLLLAGILELTNGCLMLGEISSIELRFLFAAFLLNFGGICVLMQTASVAQGLNLKYYIRGKLLQTCFAPLYCLLFLGKLGALIPIAGIFLVHRMGILRKNSSNPALVGV